MAAVTFDGPKVRLDGALVNAGSPAEGLLMGARMIQAAVEEYNPQRRGLWRYPDGPWDAERNLREFLVNLPRYADRGLAMVTVGMQGGHPRFKCSKESGVSGRNFSMFTSDGTLRADAKSRLERLIAGADAAGVIVAVQLFYQNQDNRLSGNAAVVKATDQAATFLRSATRGNVLVEIANEVNVHNYKHTALQPAQIDDRIRQVKAIWPGALVSASMSTEGRLGPRAVRSAVDWVSIHANSLSADQMGAVIRKAKGDADLKGKPIAVTEDEWDQGTASIRRAVAEGAGWSLYRQGCESTGSYKPGSPGRYRDGFQSLPVDWSPTSEPAKVAFFDELARLTGRT